MILGINGIIAGKGADSIVTSGLIMHLDAGNPLSYTGTGTVWTDLTGNNRNGTLNNGVSYSSVNGGVLNFDQVNDYVRLSNMNTALVNKTKFTYEGWIKINNPSMTDPYLQTIFSFGDNYTNDILIFVQNNILFVQINNGADGGVGISYTSNVWKYVSIVYDGTQSVNSDRIKMYINGVFQPVSVGGYTIPANTTTSTMSNCGIGAYSAVNFSGGNFGGFIGEARLYSTSLSASEVLQNFNATKNRFGL